LKAKHEKLISAISKLLDSAKSIEGDRKMKLNGYSGDIVPLIPGILCHRKQM
jgi:hypothetical protein